MWTAPMRGGSIPFRTLGALAILWGCGQEAQVLRADDLRPAVEQNRQPAQVQFYAILGQVSRPGVFESAATPPQLVDLVNRAGGPTAAASGNVRVIRGGRGGHQAFLTADLDFLLLPNDIVILDSKDAAPVSPVASTQPLRDGIVQLGLVNLISRPVVLDVSPDQATLRTVLALLHQPVRGAAQVTIVRPAGGPLEISLSQPVDIPLISGSVLVFDPPTVNSSLLPRLPATVPVEASVATESAPPPPVSEPTPGPANLPDADPPSAGSVPVRIDEPAHLDPQSKAEPTVLPPRTAPIPAAARRSDRVQSAAADTPARRSFPVLLLIMGCPLLSAILLRRLRPALFARFVECATKSAARLGGWFVEAISNAPPAREETRAAPPEIELAGYSLQESAYPLDAAYALAGPHYPVETPEPTEEIAEAARQSRPAILAKPSRKFRLDGGHLTGKPGALDRALSALDEERS